jgi:hypothetical protein
LGTAALQHSLSYTYELRELMGSYLVIKLSPVECPRDLYWDHSYSYYLLIIWPIV